MFDFFLTDLRIASKLMLEMAEEEKDQNKKYSLTQRSYTIKAAYNILNSLFNSTSEGIPEDWWLNMDEFDDSEESEG